MNYKIIDNEENICVIQGMYGGYQLVMRNMEYLNSNQLNKEEFYQTCEEFEAVISVFKMKNKVDILKDRNLGINSEDDYYDRLSKLLKKLTCFAQKLPLNLVERNFTYFLIFQKLSEYIQITDDEEKNNDADDFDQPLLKTALYMIYNCAKRSKKLSYEIIKYGILTIIQQNIIYYNSFCKSVCYSIFSMFFHNKYQIGQLAFRDFVIELTEKFITEENYDSNNFETSQISELLFSFNGYGMLHEDEEKDKEYHELASEKAFLILDKKLENCINSALKGINDLISYDWFFFEKKDLIENIFELLNNETDNERIRYLTRILGSLYEKLSNLDKNDMHFEYFYTKFYEVTKKNIKCILNLILNINEFTIKLYSSIAHLFNDFIDSFADQEFLGYLYDYLDDGPYQIKVQLLKLLTDFLLISNTNSDFFNAFFDQEFSLISKIYFSSLVLSDPEADYFNFMLEGILSAFDKNPDLVSPALHKCEEFEEFEIIPLDEKQHHLFDEFKNRYNCY